VSDPKDAIRRFISVRGHEAHISKDRLFAEFCSLAGFYTATQQHYAAAP
jgi:hypothetical protein